MRVYVTCVQMVSVFFYDLHTFWRSHELHLIKQERKGEYQDIRSKGETQRTFRTLALKHSVISVHSKYVHGHKLLELRLTRQKNVSCGSGFVFLYSRSIMQSELQFFFIANTLKRILLAYNPRELLQLPKQRHILGNFKLYSPVFTHGPFYSIWGVCDFFFLIFTKMPSCNASFHHVFFFS